MFRSKADQLFDDTDAATGLRDRRAPAAKKKPPAQNECQKKNQTPFMKYHCDRRACLIRLIREERWDVYSKCRDAAMRTKKEHECGNAFLGLDYLCQYRAVWYAKKIILLGLVYPPGTGAATPFPKYPPRDIFKKVKETCKDKNGCLDESCLVDLLKIPKKLTEPTGTPVKDDKKCAGAKKWFEHVNDQLWIDI